MIDLYALQYILFEVWSKGNYATYKMLAYEHFDRSNNYEKIRNAYGVRWVSPTTRRVSVTATRRICHAAFFVLLKYCKKNYYQIMHTNYREQKKG